MAVPTFNTFNTGKMALPYEVTTRIVFFVNDDDDSSRHSKRLLGSPGASHHPVAKVSTVVRSAYLQQPSRFLFKSWKKRALPYGTRRKICRPINTNPPIGRTLNFDGLYTLAKFFTSGPGCEVPNEPRLNKDWLANITYIRVEYRDAAQQNSVYWGHRTLEYAHEAFGLLASAVTSGRLYARTLRLQLCVGHSWHFNTDTEGMWNLMKLYGLQALIVNGWLQPGLRKLLQRRITGWRNPVDRWEITGTENPGPGDWRDQVVDQGEGDLARQQWLWLDRRYHFLHDRRTVQERRAKLRKNRDRLYGGGSLIRSMRWRQGRRRTRLGLSGL